MSVKSQRNKTICLSEEELAPYIEKCACPQNKITAKMAENKYFCGDFFKIAPFLEEKSYRLVVADPPYNLRKDYNGEVFSKKSAAEYADFTRLWLTEVKRLMTDDASLYVCCDWKSSLIIGGVLTELFKVRNRITWQREKGRGAAKNWKNCIEDIWYCTVGDSYTFNLDSVKQLRQVKAPYKENGVPKDWHETENGRVRTTCPSNFWDDITVPFWSMAENTAHPTQKPEKLIAKLILAGSNPGDRVFDPFSGAGTTAVTAKKLDRLYTGIEKSPLYCGWAQLRLERAETDKRIQGYENGVFYK